MFTRLVPLCGGYQPLPSCFTVDAGATNLGLATRQRLNASTLGCPNCSYLIALYLVLNWFANLLPCTGDALHLLYHYMGASVFRASDRLAG